MKHTFVFIILAAISLPSCKTSRHAAVESRDYAGSSVMTSITRPDTICVALPPSVESIVTRDTVSVLSNDYAVAKASVSADGTLRHSLSSIDKSIKIPVMTTISRVDSVSSTAVCTTEKDDRRYTPPLWIFATAVLICILLVRR